MTVDASSVAGDPYGGERMDENKEVGDLAKSKGFDHISMNEWLDICNRKFQHERVQQADARIEREYDHEVYDGDNFADDELARVAPKYQDLKTNFIRNGVNYLISSARNRKIEGKVLPAGGFFDDWENKKIAGEYEKRLKSVLEYDKFKKKMFKAVRDAAISGEGYLYDGLRICDENSERLEFFIEHIDWRSVWVDTKSVEPDLSDAGHLFYLRKMDYSEALSRWPKHQEILKNRAFENNLRSAPEKEWNVMSYARNANYPQDVGGWEELHSEVGNPQVIICSAYIRAFDRDGIKKLRQFNILYDQEMTIPFMLSDEPQILYGHNRIPYSRFLFEQSGNMNTPYSPLTRVLRGYDKALTAFMREAVRMVGSKVATVDEDAILRANQNPVKFATGLIKELSKPYSIIMAPGGENTVKVENFKIELDKVTSIFALIHEILQMQLGIPPELLGAKSPSISGVSMSQKREESFNAFVTFYENMDGAITGLCERVLSNMEQYAGAIQYGVVIGPAGDATPIYTDGDVTIKGNNAKWQMLPQPTEAGIMREQMNLMGAAVNKINDPELSWAALPAIAEMAGGPDSHKFSRMFIEMARNKGVPIPMSLLNEDEKKEAMEQAQKQQQEMEENKQLQKDMMKAEVGKAKAEVGKTGAETEAQKAKAFDLIASALEKMKGDESGKIDSKMEDEIKDLRDTIRAQQRELERKSK